MPKKPFIPLLLIALILILTGCGKAPSLGAASTLPSTATADGITITILDAGPETVSYSVSNDSTTPFCYEGHILGMLEKEDNGVWKSVEYSDSYCMTADFIYAEITSEPVEETIDVSERYGCKLDVGKYRIVVLGYSSFEALEKADEDSALAAWCEFEIAWGSDPIKKV